MAQEAVAHRGRGGNNSSADGGEVEISEKEHRRLEKERKEEEKLMKEKRERDEKNNLKENERLKKLAKQREKEELKAAKKNGAPKNKDDVTQTEQTPPSPTFLDEEENSLDRSPPVSPVRGKTLTIPANDKQITEEISVLDSSPKIYETKTSKSNMSLNASGKHKEVIMPVIPADRTATPKGQSKATVRLLNDHDAEFNIPKNATGQYLFDRVCEFINLEERDYFGIRFLDTDQEKSWMKMNKTVKEQAKGNPWNFEFLVKFYPPQPIELKEDLTRYCTCMQIHRDLITERLPASFTTYTILGSLMVQSELGDYDPSRHIGNYVSEVPLAPPNKQNAELEEKVMELHKENTRGMTPNDADLRYMETAKRLAFYGVDLHKAKDKENIDVEVGVSGRGIYICRGSLHINRFTWPKVLKISYRRNNFYIKIRQQELGESEQEITFRCPSQKANKRLWKDCVEHHTFFRTKTNEEPNDTLRWPRPARTDRSASEFNRSWSQRTRSPLSVGAISPNISSTSESDLTENNKGMKQARLNEYIDRAVSLHVWLTSTISRFHKDYQSSSRRETESLLAECVMCRSEELPSKLESKEQLNELYHELKILYINMPSIPVKEDLQPASLDKLWRQVVTAVEQRENSLRDDLRRYEKLQPRAEATCRSVLIIDGRLKILKDQMKQDEYKIRTLKNHYEAKSIRDKYDNELREIDESIKSSMTEAEMLQEERYYDHETIYRSVLEVEQKYISVYKMYQEGIVTQLAEKIFKLEGKDGSGQSDETISQSSEESFYFSTSNSTLKLGEFHGHGGVRIVPIRSDADHEISAIDHDEALRKAILEATQLNPNIEARRLEIYRQESDH